MIYNLFELMKKYLYIFAFLFSCLNGYAQDDLFGGFTTGSSTSSNVSSKSASQQSRSRLASNNTPQKAPNSKINKKIIKTKTETKENGNYFKYTYYEDGSYLLYSKVRCNWCGGRGTCIMCSGQGYVLNLKCTNCIGSKKCLYCGGSGHVETEQYTKKDGSGWLKNLRTGKVTNVAPSNENNTNVNTTTTPGTVAPGMTTIPRKEYHHKTYTKCNTCSGSGVCPRCKGSRGSWEWVYDHREYLSCSSCNGSGRCVICYGRGSL